MTDKLNWAFPLNPSSLFMAFLPVVCGIYIVLDSLYDFHHPAKQATVKVSAFNPNTSGLLEFYSLNVYGRQLPKGSANIHISKGQGRGTYINQQVCIEYKYSRERPQFRERFINQGACANE
jgi:hypothetical protein